MADDGSATAAAEEERLSTRKPKETLRIDDDKLLEKLFQKPPRTPRIDERELSFKRRRLQWLKVNSVEFSRPQKMSW